MSDNMEEVDDIAETNENESDSDDDMDGGDTEQQERIKELEDVLKQNPYDYQANVDYVEALKSVGDFDGLIKAREKFSELYPLTAAIWLDWIGDERRLCIGDERIFQLFDRAVKDYVSVDLWLEYCTFCIGTSGGIEKAKDLFERALTQVGVNVSRGSLLWEAYRELEMATITQTSEPEELDKVRKLFRRQLVVPLMDMEETWTEYNSWLKEVGLKTETNDERLYKNALEMLKKREAFEVEISQAESDEVKRLEAYNKYVDFEMKDGNPARIQSLCERRITDHCLDQSAWVQYVEYLDRQLKISSVSLPVYERSVRNCPWSYELWRRYIRSLERYQSPKEEILKALEQSLGSGVSDPFACLEIWLAYIDYLRRKMTDKDDDKEKHEKDRDELRAVFDRALSHVAQVGGDPNCILARYLASLEADRFHNMEEARNIWKGVLQAAGDRTKFWLEYIQLEKSFGDSKHIRRAFQRAIEKTLDDPESISEAWLQFEREEGNLDQFEDAEVKVKALMSKVAALRANNETLKEEELQRQNDKVEKRKERDLEKRRLKRRTESEIKKAGKERNDWDGQPVFKKPFLKESVNTVPKESETARGEFKSPVAPPPGFKSPVAPPPGFSSPVAPPPGFTNPVAPPPGFSAPSQTANEDDKKSRTVFLSNLDFSTDEAILQKVMSTSGEVVEVRLVKNPAGRSKGFAYVEFMSSAQARSALSRDREPLNGRPIFISECDPEKKAKGHQFKFNKGLEKTKLFVKNLSFGTTKEQLENLFSQFGQLKEVRIITFRNGHPKGLAYVEFHDEASAAKGLVKTDGTVFDGQTISVAISNPPTHKTVLDQQLSAEIRSARGFVPTRDSGPRDKLSFIPRSLSKPSSNGSTNGSTAGSKPKSNDDFRNMLGKK